MTIEGDLRILDFVKSLLQPLLCRVLLVTSTCVPIIDHIATLRRQGAPRNVCVYRSVRKTYSKINFEVRFLPIAWDGRFDVRRLLRENIPEGLQWHSALFRIEPK